MDKRKAALLAIILLALAGFFLFDLGQRIGDTAAHVVDVGFRTLGVFFDQNLAGNFLFRQGRELGWCRNIGQRELF